MICNQAANLANMTRFKVASACIAGRFSLWSSKRPHEHWCYELSSLWQKFFQSNSFLNELLQLCPSTRNSAREALQGRCFSTHRHFPNHCKTRHAVVVAIHWSMSKHRQPNRTSLKRKQSCFFRDSASNLDKSDRRKSNRGLPFEDGDLACQDLCLSKDKSFRKAEYFLERRPFTKCKFLFCGSNQETVAQP